MEIFSILLPELLVTAAALVLFMFGIVKGTTGRAIAPWVALAGLLLGFVFSWLQLGSAAAGVEADWTRALVNSNFAAYVKLIACGVGVLLLLLSWPTNSDATGNAALRYGADAGEYFGLFLLSIVGIMLCGSSNDTMLLFMAIELASIPTYVLVSISRPLPAAQEAGLKYFYLGAMSAAVMLMGFAWLYGVTGTTNLYDTGRIFAGEINLVEAGATATGVVDASATFLGGSTWQVLAIVLLVLGFCFKLAAVPLHTYAGDVYSGAATPITALLSFVPKTVGVIAMVKILAALSVGTLGLPPTVWKLLMVIAILTMTVGNVMALYAENLKRVMAYSSIAHSGYMLTALTVLAAATTTADVTYAETTVGETAIAGVLFYLAAYGIMNTGIFGVLMMLPSRRTTVDEDGNVRSLPATSAEMYSDIQGVGRRRPVLTAAMVVCCISLIGIPLTVGFLGKFFVLRPALTLAGEVSGSDATAIYWLVGFTLLNAAIAAGYYLKIIYVMTLQPRPGDEEAGEPASGQPRVSLGTRPLPIALATGLSVVGILFFGLVPTGIGMLERSATSAASAARLATVSPRMSGTPADATGDETQRKADPQVEEVAAAQ